MTEHELSHETESTLANQMIGDEIDPAGRSLAGALQTSFRLLSFIMAILLIAYLVSGMFTVKATERAVVLRFGEMLGANAEAGIRGKVLGDGLHFSWPFPVDEVVVVPTQEQTLEIDSFWHYERPGDEAKTESEKNAVAGGLRPLYDGSLLTADQGLVHVKWVVTYQIRGGSDEAVLDYVSNVDDVDALLQSAVENGSVIASASHAADEIAKGSREFTAKARSRAQMTLDELRTGIQITNLTLAAHTPPLQTLAAFRMVTVSESEREQAINEASTEATRIRKDAAGQNWEPLQAAILEYGRLVEIGNEQQSQRALDAIMALFDDPGTTGQAREVIDNAKTDAIRTVTLAQAAYNDFSKVRDSYRTNPDLTVSREWMDAAQYILSDPMTVKLFVPPGIRSTLYVEHDPSVWRTIKLREAQGVREFVDRPGP